MVVTRHLKRWKRSIAKRIGCHAKNSQGAIFADLLTLAQNTRVDPTFDVLYIIGCWEGESKRYRVFNVAEMISAYLPNVGIRPAADAQRLIREGVVPRILVVFRAALDPDLERYVCFVRLNGAKILFDVDDLVFDPSLIEQIDGYHRLNESDRALYRDGVIRYRAMLNLCDGATVTTEPLAKAVRSLGIPAHVVPNGWNDAQREVADGMGETGAATGEIVVGYFSGSATHVKDFAEVAPALERLLRERADVKLRIVGLLELPTGFDAFAERIDRLPFLDYRRMLEKLGECDINLAPLEPNNPFNEAKSELKWFEAALVRVPTIVSPTEPYRAIVENGVTGFLATTPEEWYDALIALTASSELRATIGAAARLKAIEAFGPEAISRAALAAYDLPTTAPMKPIEGCRIDWLVPGLIIGGGGHRNILRAAHFLQTFGHDVCLHFLGMDQPGEEIHDLIRRHFYPFEGKVRRYDEVGRYTDAVIATHWSTVGPALKFSGMTREVMYFVQDFEPMFAPMGTEYILAENTYRKGLYCITSGPWCARVLERDFGAECDFFEFPIDKMTYYPRSRFKIGRNILFFAKPEMPRRCYELGVEMLRHLHRLAPEVEIILFGSNAIDQHRLPFKATLRSVLPTLDDLAEMYSNADLGIAFSTTNPSLVPYEMMACGCPVVDLNRKDNEANYDGRLDIALLADPDPEIMARQVLALLDDPDQRAARAAAGLAYVSHFPTEYEMARMVEKFILGRLRWSPKSGRVDVAEVVPETRTGS